MNKIEYKNILLTMRSKIKSGLKHWYFDDTTTGNKDTQASWGMCSSDDKDIYPLGRPSKGYHHCPFDKETGKTHGCFYRCQIFQDGFKDRGKAIELYDSNLENCEVNSNNVGNNI